MPKPADLVASLLLPSLHAVAQVAPTAAHERRQRMAKDMLGFVRGSLILHAAWMSAHPLTNAPWVWSIGDAHCGNFATLATGPLNRAGLSPVTYGIADVDEEHPAPWHWDLLRLLASTGLALGKDRAAHRRLVEMTRCCLADYVRVLNAATDDDEHAERLDFHGLPEALKTAIASDADAGRLTTYRRIHLRGMRLRAGDDCVSDPAAKRLVLPAITQALAHQPPGSGDYAVLDIARRTASNGIASLGRRRWWVLAKEHDREGAWVPRLLELKERRPSVLAAFLPAQPFTSLTTGRWSLPMGGDRWQRVVPIGVGEALLRTRCHARTALDPTALDSGDLIRLARLWGQLIAVAHLTSARGLGLSAKSHAATVVKHAQKHGEKLCEMAWELVRWTDEAYRAFKRAKV